jgi:hypothetical protein
VEAPETDIEKVEGKGALNFLAIDDLSIIEEGEIIDPKSIIQLPFLDDKPIFPAIDHSCDDPFLKKIERSGKKWIILIDETQEPKLTLDADAFLRSVLFQNSRFTPLAYCHRPIIIKDPKTLLGSAISRLKVYHEEISNDVIDEDIIVFWGEEKRVITGADVLGRLLRGIAQRENTLYQTI